MGNWTFNLLFGWQSPLLVDLLPTKRYTINYDFHDSGDKIFFFHFILVWIHKQRPVLNRFKNPNSKTCYSFECFLMCASLEYCWSNHCVGSSDSCWKRPGLVWLWLTLGFSPTILGSSVQTCTCLNHSHLMSVMKSLWIDFPPWLKPWRRLQWPGHFQKFFAARLNMWLHTAVINLLDDDGCSNSS